MAKTWLLLLLLFVPQIIIAASEFEWTIASVNSTCSVTCGTGIRRIFYKCHSKSTGSFVPAKLCDASTRPQTVHRSCKLTDCPPTWRIGPWEASCADSCFYPTVRRRVSCVRPATELALPDWLCYQHHGSPPTDEHICRHSRCFPHWSIASWSACDSCNGLQHRNVRCNYGGSTPRNRTNVQVCDEKLRPASVKRCQKSDDSTTCVDNSTNEKIALSSAPSTSTIDLTPRYHTGAWTACRRITGVDKQDCRRGVRYRRIQCRKFVPTLGIIAEVNQGECRRAAAAVGESKLLLIDGRRPVDLEECDLSPADEAACNSNSSKTVIPQFVEWRRLGYSTCSAACGPVGGFRRRYVVCFGGSSATGLAPIDDAYCGAFLPIRPLELYETCQAPRNICDPEWRSRTILGVPEIRDGASAKDDQVWSLIRRARCFRRRSKTWDDVAAETIEDDQFEELPEFMCPLSTKPFDQRLVDFNQTWNVGAWSDCSNSCGFGWQRRNISCNGKSCSNATVEIPQTNRRCIAVKSCPFSSVNSSHVYGACQQRQLAMHFVNHNSTIFLPKRSKVDIILICRTLEKSSANVVTWFHDGDALDVQVSKSLLFGSENVWPEEPAERFLVATKLGRGRYSCSKNASILLEFYDEQTRDLEHFIARTGFGVLSAPAVPASSSIVQFGTWRHLETNRAVELLSTSSIVHIDDGRITFEIALYVSESRADIPTSGSAQAIGPRCLTGCAIRRRIGRNKQSFDFVDRNLCRQVLEKERRSRHRKRSLSRKLDNERQVQDHEASSKSLTISLPFNQACYSEFAATEETVSGIFATWTVKTDPSSNNPCSQGRCLYGGVDLAIIEVEVACEALQRQLGSTAQNNHAFLAQPLRLDDAYCPASERPLQYSFCFAPACRDSIR